MRKLLPVWLFLYCFSMVLPHAMTREIPEIRNLLQHFEEHRQSDQNMSFWQFLHLHYAMDTTPGEEHENLPFKHHHDCADHCSIVFISTINAPGLLIPEQPNRKEWQEQPVAAPLSRAIKIFQPPRTV